MRPHYKNIEEAMKVERPGDKIVKVLSNKFAIVQSVFTDGKFDTEKTVMGIGKGTEVYTFGYLSNMKRHCEQVERSRNIESIGWWLINPQTKDMYYKIVHHNYRKYRQNYRKIAKLI